MCVCMMLLPPPPPPPSRAGHATDGSCLLPERSCSVLAADGKQQSDAACDCIRRDKTVIMWNLTREGDQYGFARRALRGHSHFVQVLVSDEPATRAVSDSACAALNPGERPPTAEHQCKGAANGC